MRPFARTYLSHPFLVCPSPVIAPFTPFHELNRNYLSLLTHVNCMKTFYKSLLISNRIQSSSVLLLLALDTCPYLTPHVSVAISYYHWFILRPLYSLGYLNRYVLNLQWSGIGKDFKQSTPVVCGFKSSPL